MNGTVRLWRARRRHDRIDAILKRSGRSWAVEFVRNDRPMLTRLCASRASARACAHAHLAELLRAGWTDHW
jgi:hypothetical protein